MTNQESIQAAIADRIGWFRIPFTAGAIVASYCLVALLSLGKFGVEKVLTMFAQPIGLLWLLLSALMLQSAKGHGSRSQKFWLVAIWIPFTLCSTSPLADWCLSTLEQAPVNQIAHDAEEPFDVLIVFGGGTKLGPDRAEVNESGDRVLLAAELFQQQRVGQLVATGDQTGEEARDIWKRLGIPESRILVLPGANTQAEIRAIKAESVHWIGKRIAAISSAFHLPRVMRLATAAGMNDWIPVAANHRIGERNYDVRDFVPQLDPLNKFSTAQKEWLARMIGR